MTDQPHRGTLDTIADGAVGKIIARFILPAAIAVALYFLKNAFDDNQQFQAAVTQSLQTVQTGLAVTVQTLNSNNERDQKQEHDIDKLEDRLNGMTDHE